MSSVARRQDATAPAVPPPARRPRHLPAPPQVALRVLRACSDPRADARLIGGIVEQDPTITAAILRVVNSAFFGFPKKITGMRHAVSILGQRALRNYVLCLAMRDALRPDTLHGFDTTRFWRASLARAVAGRVLAERTGVDPDTSFTACLLQDIGLLALVHDRPDTAGLVDRLLDLDPDARRSREREVFATTHDALGLELALEWDMPEELAWPIGSHHMSAATAPSEEAGRLARVAACADWMAAVFDSADKRHAIERTRALCAEHWQHSQDDVDAMLGAVSEQLVEAGRALGVSMDPNLSFDAVLREANLVLAEENLGFQELAWRLQRTLDEREELSRRLRDEVEKARLVQRALLPDAGGQGSGDHGFFSGINAPARELSGDFFDYFPASGGRWCFALGDVSGKGMDAALLMSKTSSLFRCLGKAVPDPGRLMKILNTELCDLNPRGMFVTMVAGVLEPDGDRVHIANAGHPPALLLDDRGKAIPIHASAPPLGVLPDSEYAVEEHGLDSRTLHLYSDGLMEAAEERGRLTSVEAVLALIRDLSSVTIGERPARLVNALARPGQPFDDDLTVLLVRGQA